MAGRYERMIERGHHFIKVLRDWAGDDVRAAYLYGSLARGKKNQPQDIDLAIERRPTRTSERHIRDVMEIIAPGDRFHGYRVHVHILTKTDLIRPGRHFHKVIKKEKIKIFPK